MLDCLLLPVWNWLIHSEQGPVDIDQQVLWKPEESEKPRLLKDLWITK
jgi:hypothetical protein